MGRMRLGGESGRDTREIRSAPCGDIDNIRDRLGWFSRISEHVSGISLPLKGVFIKNNK